MSNLTPPPINGIISATGKVGVFSQSWTSWLINLFTALGGQSGVGGLYLSHSFKDVTTTTPIFIGVPRQSVCVEVVATLEAALTPSVTITLSNFTQSTTIGTITFAGTSPAGTVAILKLQTPSQINANDVIKAVSANSSGSSIPCLITLVLQYIG